MEWINTATGHVNWRDPQNTAWIPIGRFDAQGNYSPLVSIPTDGGDDDGDQTSLGPYATLTAGEGFATGRAGQVSVRPIVAADLPVLGPTSAGIAPAATAAQSGHVLRPGGWSPTTQNLGTKTFAGQNVYVWSGIPNLNVYKFVFQVRLNGGQILVMQLGTNGTPKTTGYSSIVKSNAIETARSDCIPLWRHYGDEATYVGQVDICEIGSGTYHISGSSTAYSGPDIRYTAHFHSIANLGGDLNYLRVLPNGNPAFSFTTQNTITSGFARLIGL